MSRPYFALFITLLIQVLASLALMTAPVLAPEASKYIDIQVTKIGVYISIAYVTAMISSLFSGYLINKYGAIRTSQLCLVLCAFGLLCSSSGQIYLLITGALLIGMGYGPITPASSDVLSRTAPDNLRIMFFSIKQTGVPLGGALAGLVLPFLVHLWHWQVSVYFVVFLCLIGAVLSQVFRKSLDEIKKNVNRFSFASVFSPMRAVLKNTDIRRLAICTMFFSIVQLCLTTYIVTYLTSDLKISLTSAGLIMFVLQGGGVFGRIMWGVIADRWWSPMWVLTFLGFLMAICSLLMATLGPNVSMWILVIICLVFGATAIGWNGVYLAEVARLAPAGQAGLMTGGTLFFTYFGVVFGPPMFAFVVELTNSFSLAYALLGGVICLISLILMRQLFIVRHENA